MSWFYLLHSVVIISDRRPRRYGCRIVVSVVTIIVTIIVRPFVGIVLVGFRPSRNRGGAVGRPCSSVPGIPKHLEICHHWVHLSIPSVWLMSCFSARRTKSDVAADIPSSSASSWVVILGGIVVSLRNDKRKGTILFVGKSKLVTFPGNKSSIVTSRSIWPWNCSYLSYEKTCYTVAFAGSTTSAVVSTNRLMCSL